MTRAVGVVVVVVMGCSSVAKADAKSWFAYGVNTSLALRQNSDAGSDGNNEHSVMSTFGIQLKLLRFFGIELGYAPFGTGGGDQLRFDNPWNMSTLLYIVPTTPVGAYLKAGVGNGGLGRILDIRGPQATYHAGAGIEVYVTNHLVLGGEFLFLSPGATPIIDDLVRTDSPRTASYYVGPSNFRASFRASYFF